MHRSTSIVLLLFGVASSPGASTKIHASYYMKGLHEVVHRDEQAQGFWRVLKSGRYMQSPLNCSRY
jgi:hypothetical protein